MQVRLRVLNGSSAGKDLKIAYDEFLVGRSDECHLRPKSDAISRRHCVIRLRNDQVFVEDLGSRNGTHLNGKRLEAETEAKHGDVLRVGKLEFEFEVEQPALASVEAAGAAQEVSDDSWVDDDDITKWLQTEDQNGANARRDPETRQFRLEETERVALETVVKSPEETTAPQAKATDNRIDSGEGVKGQADKTKQYGKLPPRQTTATGGNSREAAADMLKRFFNRP